MANPVFDSAVSLASGAGLDWLNGKWRLILVDMDDAGPSPGAWDITAMPTGGNTYDGIAKTSTLTFQTARNHGFSVNDGISIFGMIGGIYPYGVNVALGLGDYLVPATSNGKRYRVVVPGTTQTSGTPTYPTTDGQFVISGSLALMCDGSSANSNINGIWTVTAVPALNQFTIVIPGKAAFIPATLAQFFGYAAKLSNITYLSEFVPAVGRVGVSDAIAGKTILANGAMDCNDIYINTPSPADPAEALLLVKTAALNADPDLPDTQQRLIALITDASPLPLPSNPSSQLYTVPATGMMRL